jgi:SAM-dependent methyltransferase
MKLAIACGINNLMSHVAKHYETLLARHYTWMSGGLKAQCDQNRTFFRTHNIVAPANGIAVDLGCGSGFQSIPLAELGFHVIGIDTSETLLQELRANSEALDIAPTPGDLLDFDVHCPEAVDLCVCMGDTLPHLATLNDVQDLFEKVHTHLVPGGQFVLSFRDLTDELSRTERFIPVRSDANKIFTCFLEYNDDHVIVYDLVYERIDGFWNFHTSAYRKLRITPDWVRTSLERTGLTILHSKTENGLVVIIAGK